MRASIACVLLSYDMHNAGSYMFAQCPTYLNVACWCSRNNACCCWYMRTCECMRCLRGGVHALLNMWVHARFYCMIYKECWTLISFGDMCVPACHFSCGCTLTTHAHAPPLLPSGNIHCVLFRRPTPMGVASPCGPWAHGSDN